jgi:hypothetical protein
MAGLLHIKDLYQKKGKDFINDLLNKQVIVNEKMDGAFFAIKNNCEDGTIEFHKKGGKLSYIDRVLSKYYEPAIQHIESLGSIELPCNYFFGFEYFVSSNSQKVEYARLPKNNLILSYIHIIGEDGKIEKTIQDSKTLNSWADTLQVERPPIVFEGKLTDQQMIEIMDFIYTPTDQLLDKFKTSSFTKYILSVFNPEIKASFLNDNLDKAIEGLVFRFYDPENEAEDSVILAKLIDPWFQQQAIERAETQRAEAKKSDDYIWITVIDLMNYIERFNNAELRALEFNGETPDEKYVSLVNELYKGFINEFGSKYSELDIRIPDYLKKEEFNVNFDLINDPIVTKSIEENSNFKEIYRILLNVFRKNNIRISASFFTEPMKRILHSQINKIMTLVNENKLFENYFPTFNEFVGTDSEPGYFESFADVPTERRKTKQVNLIISDFQPITNSHNRIVEKLWNDSAMPTLLIAIHPGVKNKRFPISSETVSATLKKYTAANPEKIAGFFVIQESSILKILATIKPSFEPIAIAAERGKLADLALQMEHAKKRSKDLNLKRNLSLLEIPYSPVAAEALDAIKAQDFVTYKSLTPNSIHSEFFTYNRDLS